MLPTFKIATGVALVLDRRTRRWFPFIERIYGDGGHQGPKAGRAAAKTGSWTIEIVGPSPPPSDAKSYLTKALDCRTHLCLAQSFSRHAISALRQDRCRLHPPRHDSHH